MELGIPHSTVVVAAASHHEPPADSAREAVSEAGLSKEREAEIRKLVRVCRDEVLEVCDRCDTCGRFKGFRDNKCHEEDCEEGRENRWQQTYDQPPRYKRKPRSGGERTK